MSVFIVSGRLVGQSDIRLFEEHQNFLNLIQVKVREFAQYRVQKSVAHQLHFTPSLQTEVLRIGSILLLVCLHVIMSFLEEVADGSQCD